MESQLKDGCPCCGQTNCFRPLTPYSRKVIEVFPKYREGSILVPRFWCRTKSKTFSLLPNQLAPYCRYTNASMLFILLIAATIRRSKELSLFSIAEKKLNTKYRFNGCSLATWSSLFVQSFRRHQAQLGKAYKLSQIQPGKDPLIELVELCRAMGIRGPPQAKIIDSIVQTHAKRTAQFLIGIPSQYRVKLSVP